MYRQAAKQAVRKSVDDRRGRPAFLLFFLEANCESPLAVTKAARAATPHSPRARQRPVWPARESPSHARPLPRAKSSRADVASRRLNGRGMFLAAPTRSLYAPQAYVRFFQLRCRRIQGREAALSAGPCAAIRRPQV